MKSRIGSEMGKKLSGDFLISNSFKGKKVIKMLQSNMIP